MRGKVEGSGRKAGTPNRKTQTVIEICEKHNCDPFEALVIIAQTTDKEEMKVGILKDLCQYIYPKRKALEVANDPESSGFKIVIDDYSSKENK